MRHGISCAIDKELLTKVVMLGRPTAVLDLQNVLGHYGVPYTSDTEKAIAAFEAAGYTCDGERMVDADGQQLTLNLLFGPNTSKVRAIAVVVQDYLSEIGVVVDIQAGVGQFLKPPRPGRTGTCSSAGRPPSRTSCTPSGPREHPHSAPSLREPDVEQLFAENGDVRHEFARKYGEVQRII